MSVRRNGFGIAAFWYGRSAGAAAGDEGGSRVCQFSAAVPATFSACLSAAAPAAFVATARGGGGGGSSGGVPPPREEPRFEDHHAIAPPAMISKYASNDQPMTCAAPQCSMKAWLNEICDSCTKVV